VEGPRRVPLERYSFRCQSLLYLKSDQLPLHFTRVSFGKLHLSLTMEPRFTTLPASTPLSSKTELVIGGVKIYIYGLEELKRPSGEIAVMYLAHMRTRTYRVTEVKAHEILHRYRTDGRKKKYEMIAVTMDMRNHGEREVSHRVRFRRANLLMIMLQVSKEANLTWKDGNENHR
jgi:hypothetical protein